MCCAESATQAESDDLRRYLIVVAREARETVHKRVYT